MRGSLGIAFKAFKSEHIVSVHLHVLYIFELLEKNVSIIGHRKCHIKVPERVSESTSVFTW